MLDRIAMIVVVGNSRQRLFKHSFSTISEWSELANTEFALEPSRPVIKRVPINVRESGASMADQEASRAPSTPSDHRNIGVRSVIDVHLWDRAGWRGVAFTDWGRGYPPGMALMFTDADAARRIFARWRERMGKSDQNEEIYLAVVQGISSEHPAHYRLLITSQPPAVEGPSDGKMYTMISRTQTMEAVSDANLSRFLAAYQRVGAYLLLPAVLNAGQPEPLLEMAILKKKLVVKAASDVEKNDLEAMALGPQMYQELFGEPGADDAD